MIEPLAANSLEGMMAGVIHLSLKLSRCTSHRAHVNIPAPRCRHQNVLHNRHGTDAGRGDEERQVGAARRTSRPGGSARTTSSAAKPARGHGRGRTPRTTSCALPVPKPIIEASLRHPTTLALSVRCLLETRIGTCGPQGHRTTGFEAVEV